MQALQWIELTVSDPRGRGHKPALSLSPCPPTACVNVSRVPGPALAWGRGWVRAEETQDHVGLLAVMGGGGEGAFGGERIDS